MSDESTSASQEPHLVSSRPSRSPAEKAVWCIIAVVILGLGLELYARTSYENTMEAVDAAFNQVTPRPQHLSEVRKLISGLTRYGAPIQSESTSTQEEVKVTWLSPSNKYSFTLVLEKGSDDPIVEWYKMGADNWVVDPHAVPETASGSDTASAPQDMPSMMMSGAGNPPGETPANGDQGPSDSGQGNGDSDRPRRPDIDNPDVDNSDSATPPAEPESISSGQ